MTKKTILIDLDGVLNTYESNYDEGCIPLIKDGAYELLKELSSDYRIVIFTSRNLLLASKWVIENNLEEFVENVTNVKEPAYLLIDDRCIKFDGNYQNLINEIKNFNVWHKF